MSENMKDLMCILKKSVFSALAIVVLLIVQAFGELALPDYTSDIINIGIQQNGVERITPDIIRKSQLDILEFFMDDSEKSLAEDNYYVSEADYSDEYGEVCRLGSDTDSETLDKLDKAFGIPMIIASQMDENAFMQSSADGSQNAALVKTQFEDYDDSIIEQIAVSYTTAEYEALGIDMDSRQISYIVKTGVKMLLLSLLIALCSIAVTLFASRIAASASRDLRSGVFKKVIQFSGNEFNKFSTASLITRCTNDIQQLQMVIVMIFRMVLYAPIIGIGAFLKVIAQGASMSWVIGVGVISVISLVLVLLVCSMPKFKILQQLVDKLNLVSREILTGLPVIRAFSREDYEKKTF